jgi:glycosyltransferase involved in cell wall biosynthesis
MDLAIVVPARKEEGAIGRTIEEIEQKVRSPHRVVVVNDHSTDRTASIVTTIASNHSNIELVHNKREPGSGNAIATGFEHAQADLVVRVMGDLCDDAATIDLMLAKIAVGYDVVCGSRYTAGGPRIGGPRIQGFFSRFVGLSIWFLTAIGTRDVSNAFKIYRKSVLDSIRIESRSIDVSMELALKAHFAGWRMTEVPTAGRGRTEGHSKIRLFRIARGYLKWYMWGIVSRVRNRICRA